MFLDVNNQKQDVILIMKYFDLLLQGNEYKDAH